MEDVDVAIVKLDGDELQEVARAIRPDVQDACGGFVRVDTSCVDEVVQRVPDVVVRLTVFACGGEDVHDTPISYYEIP